MSEIDVATITYARVSTEEQATDGVSLEGQADRTRTYCGGHGYGPVVHMADAGISGTVHPDERPGLGEALKMLAAGQADRLVVTDLDRLGRRTRDVLALADRADSEGWHLVIISLSLDTGTPMGRLVLTVLAATAQLERDLIADRTRHAMAELKRQGKPYTRPKANPELSAKATAMAVERRADGCTLQAIADELNSDDGLPTPTGKGKWYPSSVAKLLAA